jgi:hypothetical protein
MDFDVLIDVRANPHCDLQQLCSLASPYTLGVNF